VHPVDIATAALGSWGPPWLEWMLSELGQREIAGTRHNPRITWYHSFTAAGEAPDEVAWCSSILCAAFEQQGILSTRNKGAVSWKTWGDPSPLRLGAVLYFGKSDPDARGTGHVALCGGWNGSRVLALGGNQGNAVSAAHRARETIDAIRWPRLA